MASDELEHGKVISVDLAEEMKNSYIDYAMSVIISRALPDVRDGLKPVHRRILFAMHESSMTHDRPYVKSSRPVSEVMGKYHPHGDAAIYDTMARLAQNFNTRYPMVDGHGNFGSIDGDPPAAMRYTEARLSKIAQEMLRDIEKETVNFIPNYDSKEQEPTVLPAHLPYLLMNGVSGIAVGMATNIPPHNLGEVIDGAIALLENPDLEVNELMEYIPGPDFPTAGLIMGHKGISDAYSTGRGSITMRAKSYFESLPNGKTRIIIEELPYQVNKARLIERIADLAREKKIEGITELNDESDREGMRIVMELRRDINPSVLMNQLYARTPLQENFGVIMLALVNNEPKVLTLKQTLEYYLQHQREVLLRRLNYELRRALDRAHILEGLRIAAANIDEVIRTIRASKDDDEAKAELIAKFALSDRQALAVLDMRLRRLTNIELTKIEEEYRTIMNEVQRLRTIIASDELQIAAVREDLTRIKTDYADPRRTQIVDSTANLEVMDLIPDDEVVVTLTHRGYIKRLPATTYRSQKRGGRGIAGMGTKDDDFVENLFVTTTHHEMLFFTNSGRVYRSKVYELPEAGRQAKGTNLINLLSLTGEERVDAVITLKDFSEEQCVFFATKRGIVKKTSLSVFSRIMKSGMNAINLREDDALIGVKLVQKGDEIVLATREGKLIRFSEEQVRSMGRQAAGVKGITLVDDDEVIAMDVANDDASLLTITENGFGKQTFLKQYRATARGGKGVILIKKSPRNGQIVGIRMVNAEDEIVIITSNGIIMRTAVAGISQTNRIAQGVIIMRPGEGDKVVSLAKVPPSGDSETDIAEDNEDSSVTESETPESEA